MECIFGVLILMLSSAVVASDLIQVVVSIPPQKEFVESVGKKHVSVNVLLGPKDTPVTLDLTPETVKIIQSADVYFMIGELPFEKRLLKRLKELNPDMKMVKMTAGMQFLYDGIVPDPHVWMSPKLVMPYVENIAQTLSDIQPQNQSDFKESLDKYMKQLMALDQFLHQQLDHHVGKAFLIYHPALSYFADSYGLVQIAIEEEGKHTTARRLQYIIHESRRKKVKGVFVQKQFRSNVVTTLAKKIKGRVIDFNPLDYNYLNQIREIGSSMARVFESSNKETGTFQVQ